MYQDIIPDTNTETPDESIADLEMLKHLKGLLDELDEREQLILVMRFGLDGARPKTLEEVSKIIGRTRERVRQIQNQALTKMKKCIDADKFKEDENDENSHIESKRTEFEIDDEFIKNIYEELGD